MVSRLDHPVDCKVIEHSTAYKELKIILWVFCKSIISQEGFLQIIDRKSVYYP